jgi:tripartite-type tricarboxylate transporter receptor subunit TctC
VLFASVPALMSERSDRVRPIAMAELKRSALMPQLSTIAEQGLAGFAVGNWAGLLAPAGLDRRTVDRLNGTIVAILDTPDMRERIKALGYDVIASTPDEFGAQLKDDVARWSQVVRRANIPLN